MLIVSHWCVTELKEIELNAHEEWSATSLVETLFHNSDIKLLRQKKSYFKISCNFLYVWNPFIGDLMH